MAGGVHDEALMRIEVALPVHVPHEPIRPNLAPAGPHSTLPSPQRLAPQPGPDTLMT
jgi:hypothetical protein